MRGALYLHAPGASSEWCHMSSMPSCKTFVRMLSVEQASTELLQLIGSRDGAGPYVDVLPQVTGE